jgi:hypothetical protein
MTATGRNCEILDEEATVALLDAVTVSNPPHR